VVLRARVATIMKAMLNRVGGNCVSAIILTISAHVRSPPQLRSARNRNR
jgi:hypothetical protein